MRILDRRTGKEIKVHEHIPGTELTLYLVSGDMCSAILEDAEGNLIQVKLSRGWFGLSRILNVENRHA